MIKQTENDATNFAYHDRRRNDNMGRNITWRSMTKDRMTCIAVFKMSAGYLWIFYISKKALTCHRVV